MSKRLYSSYVQVSNNKHVNQQQYSQVGDPYACCLCTTQSSSSSMQGRAANKQVKVQYQAYLEAWNSFLSCHGPKCRKLIKVRRKEQQQ